MKVAPILRALEGAALTENVLVHTGQHYDAEMSDSFFEDLGIRAPDLNLAVGSGTHGRQTAEVLWKVEEVLLEKEYSCVVVVGDVNSTIAAALAAAKVGVPVAHVEAGLRSGDRKMPEEINRILTDQLAALCLTPSRDAHEHLLREGIGEERIVFVGNVMIDTLLATSRLPEVEKRPWHGHPDRGYAVATLHRPSNVDNADQLRQIVAALEAIASEVPVYFPVHPRTAFALDRAEIELEKVVTLPPLGYRDMVNLQSGSGLVLTDSGGIQEETTVLGVPCLTLRDSTERPITISHGTNTLVPVRSEARIREAFAAAWGREDEGVRPEGWDGAAGLRVRDAIHDLIGC